MDCGDPKDYEVDHFQENQLASCFIIHLYTQLGMTKIVEDRKVSTELPC